MKKADLAYELGILFDKKITSYYRNTYKGSFGKVQIEVMDYLHENHPARTQDIADAMNIPKQHASKILSKLEECGILMRLADPSDKRSFLYTFTDQGFALIAGHIKMSNDHFEKLTEALTEADREEMISAMNILVNILHKM